jgi:DNA processing protein
MDPIKPRYLFREEIFATRPERARGVRFGGLWVLGSLDSLKAPTVAIVGSRAPSDAGRARAHALAAALAARGVCIVSGLALGIDAAAHAGALEGDGSTVAVLGGGHDHFFPKRNRPLADAIVAHGGAVLSPFRPEEPARPEQFLQRNAVVAALADKVVVVEAAERSGALNTAGWAVDMNIDVLAFPGDVDRTVAFGCNQLIRDGAILVRGADDVLEALGLASDPTAIGLGAPTLFDRYTCDPTALAIFRALTKQDLTLDALIDVTGSPPGAILSTLVRLEVDGAIERRDGANFGIRTAR